MVRPDTPYSQHLSVPDTKLVVDGKEFHRQCFTCHHCSSLLDSVYGIKDGQYYCEGCYVENFGKKCSHCGQTILGPGLKFASQTFHRDCFKCWRCGEGLQGAANTLKGKPVCDDCYQQNFLETCAVCHQAVSQGISFREEKFHQGCFKCRTCGLMLEEKGKTKGEFLLTVDGLQCTECLVSAM